MKVFLLTFPSSWWFSTVHTAGNIDDFWGLSSERAGCPEDGTPQRMGGLGKDCPCLLSLSACQGKVLTGQAAELSYFLFLTWFFSQEFCWALVLLSKVQEVTHLLSCNTEWPFWQGVDRIKNQWWLFNDYSAKCWDSGRQTHSYFFYHRKLTNPLENWELLNVCMDLPNRINLTQWDVLSCKLSLE